MKYFLLLFVLGINLHAQAIRSISIETPSENLENSISALAIQDVMALLKQACNCEVDFNLLQPEIKFVLPLIDPAVQDLPTAFALATDVPFSHYPQHFYSWRSHFADDIITLTLSAPTYHGISFGLYGLLQEQLNFRFYHPKESIIPTLHKWPIAHVWEWEAQPRFDKKGFHLHTMHPIELTEQLLDHNYPGGLDDVKAYIDWLVRNGQNYFEFNLLSPVNMQKWPEYARQYVEYGQARGVLMGIDVSLNMIQQKAYKLYKNAPASFRKKEKQIDRNLERLFVAGWDFVHVEFNSTEFIAGNRTKREKLRIYLTDQVRNKYGAYIMSRKHVVNESEEVLSSKKPVLLTPEEEAIDRQRGIMIHSVMFYTLSEEKAPVYQNENLQFLLKMMKEEQKKRETWYYPESAYWVTFDNSIPLLLLPYLSARLDDINLMDEMGIPGHVTFSSGWEWGYWLIDWSIARWSWNYVENGVKKEYTPTTFVSELFNNDSLTAFFDESLELQEDYLKEQELMRYMTAQSPTDELPSPFNKEFHPRPLRTYKWMRYHSDKLSIVDFREQSVTPMLEFARKQDEISEKYRHVLHRHFEIPMQQSQLLKELYTGTMITALRASHRANKIDFLLSKRERRFGIFPEEDAPDFLTVMLELRSQAQEMVTAMEENYRFPVELLARRRASFTAYNHGYLYTVSKLHFWHREEEQVRRDKYGPFFMNIWNIGRIMGIKK